MRERFSLTHASFSQPLAKALRAGCARSGNAPPRRYTIAPQRARQRHVTVHPDPASNSAVSVSCRRGRRWSLVGRQEQQKLVVGSAWCFVCPHHALRAANRRIRHTVGASVFGVRDGCATSNNAGMTAPVTVGRGWLQRARASTTRHRAQWRCTEAESWIALPSPGQHDSERLDDRRREKQEIAASTPPDDQRSSRCGDPDGEIHGAKRICVAYWRRAQRRLPAKQRESNRSVAERTVLVRLRTASTALTNGTCTARRWFRR